MIFRRLEERVMRFARTVFTVAAIMLVVVEPAFAEEAAAGAGDLGRFAAGIGIAIAALGGALGQGKAVAAALESIGRNPGAAGQMFTPMIVGLVLIESLVIYALVIAARLVGLF
jgi:F-type H+-transporting ATPase subunit c